MKHILQSAIIFIGLAFTGASVQAAPTVYGTAQVATTGESCNTANAALGLKLLNGYGPQVRAQTFTGDSCVDSEARLALDVRKDFKLGTGGLIASAQLGTETNTDFEKFKVVAGASVTHKMTKSSLLGASIFNAYPNGKDSETFIGMTLTHLF